jgi:hypothetical protein
LNRGHGVEVCLDALVPEAPHHLDEDGDAGPIVNRLSRKEPAAVEDLSWTLEGHVVSHSHAKLFSLLVARGSEV